MQTIQLALPAIATVALGTALLLPLRDDRRGKRATFQAHGDRPFTVDFRAVATAPDTRDAPQNMTHSESLPEATPRERTAVDRIRSRSPIVRRLFAALGLRDPSGEPAPSNPAVSAETDDGADTSFAERLAALLPDSIPGQPDAPARETCGAPVAEPQRVAEAYFCESEPLVVRRQLPACERAVPLTRLPLRSHPNVITWFARVDGSRGAATRAERHALLSELAHVAGDASVETMALAYREEDAEGRLIAMRALARMRAERARPIFAEALRAGTDDERAFAIDALLAVDAPDELVVAFSDRVEAIAAKAALAYVGTNVPDDYRRALAPFLDGARIEALLALLAGFLE